MNKLSGDIAKGTSQALIIDGASCASCVGKIEKALQAVTGVESAEMNFGLRTVLVTGDVGAERLIKTIESIGYNAKSTHEASDDELLDAKEVADEKYYARLMKQMWLALGLGLPLMIYSIAGGAMTVDSMLEQAIWLFIGVLCAGIMYVAGKHFYIGSLIIVGNAPVGGEYA